MQDRDQHDIALELAQLLVILGAGKPWTELDISVEAGAYIAVVQDEFRYALVERE
jgi:hypothetical protein